MSETTTVAKRRSLALVTELDQRELALRLAEAGMGLTRPEGQIERAIGHLDEIAAGGGPDFRRMAEVALLYFKECIEHGRKPS